MREQCSFNFCEVTMAKKGFIARLIEGPERSETYARSMSLAIKPFLAIVTSQKLNEYCSRIITLYI